MTRRLVIVISERSICSWRRVDDPDGIAGQILDRFGVREKAIHETVLVLATMDATAPGSTLDPGDAATAWFDPRRLSNHPIVLTEPA